jgi:hypothetical protein
LEKTPIAENYECEYFEASSCGRRIPWSQHACFGDVARLKVVLDQMKRALAG